MDLFSRCVGMGDSFTVTITAVPVPRKGAIAFQDTQVSTPKDSYYIRRVRSAMMRTFDQDFKIEIRDQARRLLEQPAIRHACISRSSRISISTRSASPRTPWCWWSISS